MMSVMSAVGMEEAGYFSCDPASPRGPQPPVSGLPLSHFDAVLLHLGFSK